MANWFFNEKGKNDKERDPGCGRVFLVQPVGVCGEGERSRAMTEIAMSDNLPTRLDGLVADARANIIGLCQNCHRQLHFGQQTEIRDIPKPIYFARADRFHNSGFTLSKDEFLALAAG